MTDDVRSQTLTFFASENSIPRYADAAKVSREIAARRVKALVEDGKMVAVGKENRDGKGIQGQRPMLYRTKN